MRDIRAAALLVAMIVSGPPLCLARQLPDARTDTLAEVGPRVITARDLIERMEFMPWPGKENPSAMDSLKHQALQSLAAEQILAMEASAQGIGDDTASRRHIRELEKLMVRDALFRQEVKPRVSVSPAEVRRGLKRFAWIVTVLMISSGSEGQAREVSAALRAGARLDSLLHHPPANATLGSDSVVVKFGLLEEPQEDAVYSLSESSPVSAPLYVERLGWVVLYLLKKETNPEFEGRTVQERALAVEAKIRERKEIDQADRYSADVLSRFTARARPEAFRLLDRTLRGAFAARSRKAETGGNYRIADVLDTVETIVGSHLNDVLVEMKGGGMTIGDLLENLRVIDVRFPTIDEHDFPQLLNKCIKDAVARELLSREGYRRNLQQDPEVEHDVAVWADYWRASALELRLVKGVTATDDEVLDSLLAHIDAIGRDYQVDVREILSDSLGAALAVLDRLSAGAPMENLARALTTRREWAGRGGESGYFSIIDHPLLGLRALQSDTGRLVGPLKLPEGYSVFVVLGKRQSGGDSVTAFPALVDGYRNELAARRRQDILNRFVAGKTKEYHVRFYYHKLASVDIPPVNMVTRRFIGFGGSMLAAPALYPVWRWIKGAANVEEVMP